MASKLRSLTSKINRGQIDFTDTLDPFSDHVVILFKQSVLMLLIYNGFT